MPRTRVCLCVCVCVCVCVCDDDDHDDNNIGEQAKFGVARHADAPLLKNAA